MRRVIVPGASGVLSALGLVISERRRDFARSALFRGTELTAAAVGAVVDELAAAGRAELGADSAKRGARTTCATGDRRSSSRWTAAPSPIWPGCAATSSGCTMTATATLILDAELELVTVRVAVAEPGAAEPDVPAGAAVEEASRPVLFEGGEMDAVVMRGVPERVAGPAVCNLAESTVVPHRAGRERGRAEAR